MITLENLYYGNIAPHEYEVERGSEYDIIAKLVIRHEQELSATLTEQQKTILEKVKDNHTELMNLGERDARRVLPRFLFGCQTSDRSHELQNLTCEISPCVAQIKRTQTNPKSLNNPHTADLSRFVDAKRHKLRVHRDSWLVPLLLIITTVKI